MDFQSIRGQEHVKRGLEVALTGNHGVLLIGPPNPDIAKLIKATHAINGVLPIYSAWPCPCGHFTNPKKECNCTPEDIQKHLGDIGKKIPLDQIEIHIEVPKLNPEHLTDKRRGEKSEVISKRIFMYSRTPVNTLDKEANELLKLAILELGISSLAYDKILCVAGTIARMDGKGIIEAHHISEAISYRSLDRNLWG